MIQLAVSRIKNSPGEELHLDKDIRLEEINNGSDRLLFAAPLRLRVDLLNENGTIKLNGTVEGKAKAACSRCLELFDISLRAELDHVYYNESQQDLEPEEDWVPFRGERLDITSEVENALLASLPMKLLCRRDCRGLCQRCGADLNKEGCNCGDDNIDPRLEVLKNLLDHKRI